MNSRARTLFKIAGMVAVCMVVGLTVWFVRESRRRELNAKLVAAVEEGNLAQTQEMLKRGADPNANEYKREGGFLGLLQSILHPPQPGWNALYKACIAYSIDPQTFKPIVVALIRAGANPDDRSIPRGFILSPFVANDDPDMVSLLLDRRASVSAKDNAGLTPLMYSVISNRSRIISLLLSRGANPNTKDIKNETMLELAFQYGASEDDIAGVVKDLLEHGADPNSTMAAAPDVSLCAVASYNGWTKVVKLMRDHGAKPEMEPTFAAKQ